MHTPSVCCHIDWLARYYVMSLTRRLHMRLARPAPLRPPLRANVPTASSFLSLSISPCLAPSKRAHTALHATSATGNERESEDGIADGSPSGAERERINTRADTYRGRINHRKIMHVTSAERVCNGETCASPLLVFSLFLSPFVRSLVSLQLIRNTR